MRAVLSVAVQALAPDPSVTRRKRRGIQAIETGHDLLAALALVGRPIALKDLAGAAGMTPGRAHPYLVSFARVGLVTQDALTGHYGLGATAIQLGLVALQELAPVRLAREEALALAQSTGRSVALSVWSPLGPTVVRLVDPGLPLPANPRTGTVMSILGTATGRLFAAHLPRRQVDEVLARDSARHAMAPPSGSGSGGLEDLEAALDDIRRRGHAATVGSPLPGILSVAAPVFDARGELVLGLTLMDRVDHADSVHDGSAPANVAAARATAEMISRRLGHVPVR